MSVTSSFFITLVAAFASSSHIAAARTYSFSTGQQSGPNQSIGFDSTVARQSFTSAVESSFGAAAVVVGASFADAAAGRTMLRLAMDGLGMSRFSESELGCGLTGLASQRFDGPSPYRSAGREWLAYRLAADQAAPHTRAVGLDGHSLTGVRAAASGRRGGRHAVFECFRESATRSIRPGSITSSWSLIQVRISPATKVSSPSSLRCGIVLAEVAR